MSEPPAETPQEPNAEPDSMETPTPDEHSITNTAFGEVTGNLVQISDVALYLAAGAPAVTATALITWLKQRRSDISLKITRKDGTMMELSAQRVEAPEELVAKMVTELDQAASVEIVPQGNTVQQD